MAIVFYSYRIHTVNHPPGDLCDCQHQSNSEMWNNLKTVVCSNSLNTVVLGCPKKTKNTINYWPFEKSFLSLNMLLSGAISK